MSNRNVNPNGKIYYLEKRKVRNINFKGMLERGIPIWNCGLNII